MLLNPYVNQEANNAEIGIKRESKLGMLSAMVHAITHSVRVIPAHDPMASQVREKQQHLPTRILTKVSKSHDYHY